MNESKLEQDGGKTVALTSVQSVVKFAEGGANTAGWLVTTASGQKLRVIFYRNDLVRIWLADGGTGDFSQPDADVMLVRTDFGATPQVTLSEDADAWTFVTDAQTLRLYKASCAFEVLADGKTLWKEACPIKYGEVTTQTMVTDANEYFYGGGMQMGSFSHKGKKIKMDRGGWKEGGAPNPVSFYMSSKGYGVLRVTYSGGTYDFSGAETVETSHADNRFDAFYFCGADFESLICRYTELTGRAELIPKWALGFGDAGAYRQQYNTKANGGNAADKSKYLPATDPSGGFWENKTDSKDADARKDEVKQSALGTVRVGIDVKRDYIDQKMPVAWMLPSDGYGCEYNSFTHPGGGLDVAAFGSKITGKTPENAKGEKTDIPGLMTFGTRLGLWIGEPTNYTQENGYTYGFPASDVDKPEIVEPAFNREIREQVAVGGVRFYKIDEAWSEKKTLKGDIAEIFKRIMDNIKANANDERGAMVTVYAAAGAQRYTTVWSGDQSADADYVRYHIPSFTGAGMSGFPYATSDQASIYKEDNGAYERDIQMKSLMPMNYAMNNWGGETQSTKRPSGFSGGVQTPNRFTPAQIENSRKYLILNRTLTPYLYTYARKAYDTGAPIVRPLVYNFPNDEHTRGDATQYQYMSGEWLLAAPVYNYEETTRGNIYLPEGSWTDYWTGKIYTGLTTITVDAPMDTMPIFVRGGAIIPMRRPSIWDGQKTVDGDYMSVDDSNGVPVDDGALVLDIYPCGKSSFKLYEDDGYTMKYKNGEYAFTEILSEAKPNGLTVTIGASNGAYLGKPESRAIASTVHTATKPAVVKVNGNALLPLSCKCEADKAPNGGWFYDATAGGRLFIKTPSHPTDGRMIIEVATE